MLKLLKALELEGLTAADFIDVVERAPSDVPVDRWADRG